jgi:hypothetical protein
MTLFVDLRASANGGIVADTATVWENGNLPVPNGEFARRVYGRKVLFAMHGFNVDRESGVRSLSNWAARCNVPASWLVIGVLWPGDSVFAPIIDYVYEGVEAIASGKLLADFLNLNAPGMAGLCLASHSLGARVLLEATRRLDKAPDKIFIMAGAIENDCLQREYADAARRVGAICTIASREDAVLEWAFPAGNLVGEIIMNGHPYDRTAIGREGPLQPVPDDLSVTSWQVPDDWDYGHLDYLSHQLGPAVASPVPEPGDTTPPPFPANQKDGWKASWSAETVATLVR